MDLSTKKMDDYVLRLGTKTVKPIFQGGMGVNISTKELALEVARLGGGGHISDAMMPDVADRLYHTRFTALKARRYKDMAGLDPKPDMHFDPVEVERATRLYVEDVMSAKKGDGLIFINCMEKLTMNASTATLKTRLNAALDGGIDVITLSAGLHLSSMKLMQDNPRFHEALIGIVVSSTRALQIFMKRAQAVGRLPDYVVVEGPLAGGHLGFGDDWAEYYLEDIVRDVVKWIGDNGFDIPVFAAGGIFSGEDAVHFVRDVGAAGVQVATRFAVAQESGLPEAVKQRYIDATDDDVQVNHFSTTGYPMRMLKDSPAITSDIRPNCEAYGYLLQKGECSYVKEWFARHGKIDIQPVPEHSKCCLCTHMRNFKVWTCGASVSRLKNVTKHRPDGSWQLPTAEEVWRDYVETECQHLPKAA